MAASNRVCGKCCPDLETQWCNDVKTEYNQHYIACYAESVSDVFLLFSLGLHGQSPFVLCSVCSCILFSGVFNLFFKGWLLSLNVKIHHSVSVICFFVVIQFYRMRLEHSQQRTGFIISFKRLSMISSAAFQRTVSLHKHLCSQLLTNSGKCSHMIYLLPEQGSDGHLVA